MHAYRLPSSLEDLTTGWGGVASRNRKGLWFAWEAAESLAGLHHYAMQRIASAPSPLGESKLAELVAGTHALNLFVTFLGITVRGQYGVAAYLLRALLDAQSLLFGVVSDTRDARRFLRGTLTPAAARRRLVATLNGTHPAVAYALNERLLADYDVTNVLAHTKSMHGAIGIELTQARTRPLLEGKADASLTGRFVISALENELWCLHYLWAYRDETLEKEWLHELLAAQERIHIWIDVFERGEPR